MLYLEWCVDLSDCIGPAIRSQQGQQEDRGTEGQGRMMRCLAVLVTVMETLAKYYANPTRENYIKPQTFRCRHAAIF